MTVRCRPSMTLVASSRRRRISSFPPAAVTFPSEIAIASTNEGTAFVAILALCKMISADTRISFSVFYPLSEKAEASFRPLLLLVRCGRGWNFIFGKLRCRQTMHHGVDVLDPDAVGPEMSLHNVHDRVIRFTVGPIALPFEHRREGRHWFCSRLDDSLH